MSGRRQRSSGRSEFTENEINDLASRLQALLPQPNQQTRNSRVSVLEILKETCSHIKRLQKDVEDLSETLTGLLDSLHITDIDITLLQDLLQQK
ncbi:transcription factor ILI3-like isoform X2 [Arachis ipaensis]|uniref:transcription factor ILI3-like isoform X2 n=1 Tax=Arachis ipaensis TaxID=130454 RepID=UPI000A2B3390|nr:transcription factor ILI3-like isoform X2 [Arachis ipaensis]XP_025635363.1 transcription factor ILI3-like [Arachis hypogaea]